MLDHAVVNVQINVAFRFHLQHDLPLVHGFIPGVCQRTLVAKFIVESETKARIPFELTGCGQKLLLQSEGTLIRKPDKIAKEIDRGKIKIHVSVDYLAVLQRVRQCENILRIVSDRIELRKIAGPGGDCQHHEGAHDYDDFAKLHLETSYLFR